MVQPPAQTAAATQQTTTGSTTYFEVRLASYSAPSVVATTSAAAVAGATTLAVTALTGPIPAGAVLHFPTGDATLTAAAAAAATSLSVLPLDTAIPSAAASSYDGYFALPILGDVNLSFSPTDVNYQAYVSSGLDVWDYASKVSMAGKLDFKTGAPDNDPAVYPLVQAGMRSGGVAGVQFRLRRASGSWYTGFSTLGVNMNNPARGIAETMFTGTTSGRVVFTPNI